MATNWAESLRAAGPWLAAAGRAVGLLERSARPVFDLGLRLALAGPYFASGIVKAADWDKAVYLATNEYPVSWLAPHTAAVLGVTVELVGSVLFAAGLATRAAAAALLALAVVIHLSYVQVDSTLFWIALLAGYVVRGAGGLALDRVLAPGLATSPLPFADAAWRAAQALSRAGTPAYLLLLRGWLAATLLAVAGAVTLPGAWTAWLPLASAPVGLAGVVVLAVALAAGFAARLVSLALLLGLGGMMIMGDALDPNGYWVWALAGLVLSGAGALSVDGLLARLARSLQLRVQNEVGAARDLPRVVARTMMIEQPLQRVAGAATS